MRKKSASTFKLQGVWFLLIFFRGVVGNIDRLELIMPRYALKGGEVTLKCDHSVRLEHLHKVEWRKGEDKLFRYVKGRQPPFLTWEIPGAHLNSNKSSETQIHLTNLTFAAGGSYYCVVSMETPSIFTKDSDIKDLTIIDPQSDDPQITFRKDTYSIGEVLEANCTTSPSKPPPHITWLINDEKVQESLTKPFSNGVMHGHGHFMMKAISIKQLSIEVATRHFKHEKMKLTCMATIPAYVNKDSDYADVRKATAEIDYIAAILPALPASVEAASSARSPEVCMLFYLLQSGPLLIGLLSM
ncbi:hypothetical protein ABEB36_010049 [Hypothenemus hampei]|uniref:Ig-like domain-containing protein n=1 Tax=Hypothenemus hampei TaxID=57062 RepID=A0ABD1EIB7_HYPHA